MGGIFYTVTSLILLSLLANTSKATLFAIYAHSNFVFE